MSVFIPFSTIFPATNTGKKGNVTFYWTQVKVRAGLCRPPCCSAAPGGPWGLLLVGHWAAVAPARPLPGPSPFPGASLRFELNTF